MTGKVSSPMIMRFCWESTYLHSVFCPANEFSSTGCPWVSQHAALPDPSAVRWARSAGARGQTLGECAAATVWRYDLPAGGEEATPGKRTNGMSNGAIQNCGLKIIDTFIYMSVYTYGTVCVWMFLVCVRRSGFLGMLVLLVLWPFKKNIL